MKKQKVPKVYIGDHHRGIVSFLEVGTKAGLILWKQLDTPSIPHLNFPEGGLSFQGTVGDLTIRTGWAFDAHAPMKDWPVGVLTIVGVNGETFTVTDDPRVIAGVAPVAESTRFIADLCESIQRTVQERSVVASLERELLRLFHPA